MSDASIRAAKRFESYSSQVKILQSRGMEIADPEAAVTQLRNISYYRLSGYWYPFRKGSTDGKRSNAFVPGTTFDAVLALYQFDARLRAAVLTSLEPIELALRARLGHRLGEIGPLIYLDPMKMGPQARNRQQPSERYQRWLAKYHDALEHSREDFVEHHRDEYGGVLPVCAAVEVLDWGSTTHLFGLSPAPVRDSIAAEVGLTGPQLESWMKALNIVRNVAAHNGRLYNRDFALTPRLPREGDPALVDLSAAMNRSFGQLSLIQYLLHELGVGNPALLRAALRSYPDVPRVPTSSMGLLDGWEQNALWR